MFQRNASTSNPEMLCALYFLYDEATIVNLLTLHTEAARPPQAVYAMPLLWGVSWTNQRLVLHNNPYLKILSSRHWGDGRVMHILHMSTSHLKTWQLFHHFYPVCISCTQTCCYSLHTVVYTSIHGLASG